VGRQEDGPYIHSTILVQEYDGSNRGPMWDYCGVPSQSSYIVAALWTVSKVSCRRNPVDKSDNISTNE
jgi:hypothetical protein